MRGKGISEKFTFNGEEYVFGAYKGGEKEVYKDKNLTLYPNNWYCYLLKNDNIIATYFGYAANGRSYDSLIKIVESERNKGLCTVFTTKVYNYLINVLKVEMIIMNVSTLNMKGASRCYIKSAWDNDLYVYMKHERNYYPIEKDMNKLMSSIDKFIDDYCCYLYFSVNKL